MRGWNQVTVVLVGAGDSGWSLQQNSNMLCSRELLTTTMIGQPLQAGWWGESAAAAAKNDAGVLYLHEDVA